MEIQNNTLLNILLPNDNKVIKEALQQADLNQLGTSAQSKSIQTILNNLFNDIISGTKSNETIMNLLKNSSVSNDLNNFPKELQSLLNLIKSTPTLNAFESKIENFMVNIKDINETNLKSQISNSGIFLEAKIGSSLTSSLSNDLSRVLNELKISLLNISKLDSSDALKIIETILNNLNTPNYNLKADLSVLQQLLSKLVPTQTLGNPLSQTSGETSLFQTINKLETLLTKEGLSNPNFSTIPNEIKFLKDELSTDMKAVLLQLQKEVSSNTQQQHAQEMLKHLDKLLVQIDYNQLMSLTTHSNILYLPFLWDLLEDGTIATAKSDEEKFYCQINLTLKEHGKLDLLVALYQNNIDITMHAQKLEFKEQLQASLPELKRSLSSVGLVPKTILLYELKEPSKDEELKKELHFVNQYKDELSFGISIRV
ncbi:MAG: flagellar hook-length control protein FliK [Arcobacteraceae bacterium]